MISREIDSSSFRNDLPMSRYLTWLAVVEMGDLRVDGAELVPHRVGLLAAGEDAQEQDLGLGQPLPQLLDDRRDALGDLLGRGRAGVVRADHQHDDLRLDAVELAVLDTPEDVLGPVAADAEVGRVPGPVEPLPDVIIIPPLRDRIAEEEQVDRPPFLAVLRRRLGPLDEPVMHVHPTALSWGGDHRLGSLGAGRQAGREQADHPDCAKCDRLPAQARRHQQYPRMDRHLPRARTPYRTGH